MLIELSIRICNGLDYFIDMYLWTCVYVTDANVYYYTLLHG